MFVNDSGIGPRRTMILVRLDRLGCWYTQPASHTEICRIIVKTAVPFGNVEVQGDRKMNMKVLGPLEVWSREWTAIKCEVSNDFRGKRDTGMGWM